MPYQVIEDFRLGMDRRKSRVAGVPGSLWLLKNAMIGRGGEIERAKKFVSTYTCPAGTFGLAMVGDSVYVFGSGVDPGVPSGVTHQRLRHPDLSTAMTAVLSRDVSQGKLYVVARYADNSVHHFYDGELVRDWDAGRVTTAMLSNDGTAAHLAALINAQGTNYFASSTGAVVRITHRTVNIDFLVTLTAADGGTIDNQTLAHTVVQAATAALPKVIDVTVGGTYDVGDKFSIVLGTGSTQETFGYAATPDPVGTLALSFKSKMYSPGGSLLNFSGVNRPDVWNRDHQTVPGAGFINVSTQDGGSSEITGLEIYEGNMAVFGKLAVQIWNMSDDPASNALVQNLRKTGTQAGKSVKSLGSIDVFYLARSGIRSLRARSGTSVAFSSDIGSPIDPFVQEHIGTLSDATISAAVAEIEPRDERYWLALDSRVYVFSYFPSAEISAWSYIEPGFVISDMARSMDKIYVRSGDTIYLYGGSAGTTYPNADEQTVQADLHFLTAQSPGTDKVWNSVSVGCTGTWTVEVMLDPSNDALITGAGTITGTTYQLKRFKLNGTSSHIGFRFKCAAAGDAKISNLLVRYDEGMA